MKKSEISKLIIKSLLTNMMMELVLEQVKYLLEHHKEVFVESFLHASKKVAPPSDILEKLMEEFKK